MSQEKRDEREQAAADEARTESSADEVAAAAEAGTAEAAATATAVADEEAGERAEGPEAFREALKKVLDVQVEEAGVLRKRLTITIPAGTIQEERDRQYGELIHDAIVPGFRRGRAPRRLVEKRFGQEVGDQVQTKLVSNSFLAATDLKSIRVLGEPQVWCREKGADEEKLVDLETALKHMKLPDDGPLAFRCEVEVWPELTLPELQGIRVRKPKVKITDEDVTKQVDRMRSFRGSWEPLAEGTVEADDLLIADVRVTAGGETIKSEENVQVFARPQRVEGIVLSKLGEQLAGAAAGQTRTIEETIADDHEREELRGKKAEFAFTIHEIKRFRLPPLDAALLSAMGFDSEAELREFVRQQMEAEATRAVRRSMRGQISRHLLTQTKLELPEGLSRRHVERAILRRVIELRREGVPPEEIDKHADELRTSAAAEAIEGLKLHFILEEIAEKLGIEVSEEEINAQIAAIARRYNRRFDRVRDELAQNDGLTALYVDIRQEKSLERLLQDAEIEETEGPAESLSELADAT